MQIYNSLEIGAQLRTSVICNPATNDPEITFLVSESVLVRRIRKKLAQDGYDLRRTDVNERYMYGYYFVADCSTNSMTDWSVDVEKLGRELGALQYYEVLAD